MFTPSFFPKQLPAPRPVQRRMNGWFRVKHSWIIAAAALQSACSLLIEFDDGIEEQVNSARGGSTSGMAVPDAGPPDGAAALGGSDGLAGSGGAGAADAGAGGSERVPPPFDLAFIEDPEESGSRLRLVNSALALGLGPDAADEWRLTLRPATQAGDVLDFAWSPDGSRIAVRYVDVVGVRIAFFAAPDWVELDRVEAVSPAILPDVAATANYRWSPSGDALALELSGAEQPLVSGYVIEGATAFGVEPVPFSGPIAAMDWRSPTSLYVIQPEDGAPELLDVRLSQRAFATPASLFSVLFFPVELRRVPGGLVAADDEPSSLNFWPESADQGSESSFTTGSYLSGGASFVAEIVGTEAQISPIGSVLTVVDTVPDCPTVLTWVDGPERGSLAGAKLACLSVQNDVAAVSVHSYDAGGARSTVALDHDVLRSDFVSTESWEAHARGFSPGGEFLALATAAHDVRIDLRGATPSFEVDEVATPGNTALGFSPSGRVLIEQRGRSVEAILRTPQVTSSLRDELPPAFAETPACVTSHHAAAWCGGDEAARRASARWSRASDAAAFLAEGEGLAVLGPTDAAIGLQREFVSTCGAGCVRQYEFGR